MPHRGTGIKRFQETWEKVLEVEVRYNNAW